MNVEPGSNPTRAAEEFSQLILMRGRDAMGWMDTLRQLMPSHRGAGDAVDWTAVEHSWGTGFPRDYQEFITLYGAGTVDDYLSFLLPEPRTAESVEPIYQGMEAETLNALDFWQYKASEESRQSGLIAWGVDSSADILCWRVTGSDPDAWPVVVWNQDDAAWLEYPCGLVEFLCRVLRAEFDECPLGSVSLWGNASPRFLHHDEEARLGSQGLDPWTGEPDPFAGMFGD
ncbi:SMI1/KNR4 family protein [Streptomyces canus]|uniref:SMI1/KNR4 family protein n=1 Tax=Streptomyces canus TaxID=58343 RepID=UPI002E33F8B6|nr:SMI1/KNR4 family protein [Streptomyces canus]